MTVENSPKFKAITQDQVTVFELALRNAAIEAGFDWEQAIYVMGLCVRALADTAPKAHGMSAIHAKFHARSAFEQGYNSDVITPDTTRH